MKKILSAIVLLAIGACSEDNSVNDSEFDEAVTETTPDVPTDGETDQPDESDLSGPDESSDTGTPDQEDDPDEDAADDPDEDAADDPDEDTVDVPEPPEDPFVALCPAGARTSGGSDDFLADHECPATGNAITPGEDDVSDGWQLVALPGAEESGAVCNLGDPFTFNLRPGQGADKDNWVIYLRGGGACSNQRSCAQRLQDQPFLMCPETASVGPDGGIFNQAEANPWHDWTHVYLHYCSSDGWHGDAGPTDARSYYFRGHVIVEETIAFLLDPPDGWPDLSEAELVLFAGGSAGANGYKHNVDAVAEMVAPVRVVGFNDAAVVPAMPDLDRTATAAKACYQNLQPDASCLVDESDPVRCTDHTNVLVNHVETPTFVFMDQFDREPLGGWNLTPLCVTPQCNRTNACETGRCVGNTLCFAGECSLTDACDGGATCGERGCFVPQCTSDECGDGANCEQGLCVTGTDCGDCGEGSSCLPRNDTPLVQEFSMKVRDIIGDLPAAYSSRRGIHVIGPENDFGTRYDDHPSVAEIMANWLFELGGPTQYIWQP